MTGNNLLSFTKSAFRSAMSLHSTTRQPLVGQRLPGSTHQKLDPVHWGPQSAPRAPQGVRPGAGAGKLYSCAAFVPHRRVEAGRSAHASRDFHDGLAPSSTHTHTLPRTNHTRLVPPSALTGHATSMTPKPFAPPRSPEGCLGAAVCPVACHAPSPRDRCAGTARDAELAPRSMPWDAAPHGKRRRGATPRPELRVVGGGPVGRQPVARDVHCLGGAPAR